MVKFYVRVRSQKALEFFLNFEFEKNETGVYECRYLDETLLHYFHKKAKSERLDPDCIFTKWLYSPKAGLVKSNLGKNDQIFRADSTYDVFIEKVEFKNEKKELFNYEEILGSEFVFEINPF